MKRVRQLRMQLEALENVLFDVKNDVYGTIK